MESIASITLLHSERPKLYTILAFQSAIGLSLGLTEKKVAYFPSTWHSYCANSRVSADNDLLKVVTVVVVDVSHS